MKTEKELMEWAAMRSNRYFGNGLGTGPSVIATEDCSHLFKGMKLVSADSVVMELNLARRLMPCCEEDSSDWDSDERELQAAIAQASEGVGK